MAGVNREWVEKIKDAIADGFNTGKITTLEDLDRVALDVWDSLGIKDNGLRAAAIFVAKNNNPIFIALRQEAAEIHLPITNDSPIEHLPISKRVCKSLSRGHYPPEGLKKVGDIVFLLAKEGRDGLQGCRNLGEKGIQEILDALAWADIEIPAQITGTQFSKEEKPEDVEGEESSDVGVPVSSAPVQRIIQLERGEIFTAEIIPDTSKGSTHIRIFSSGKSFGIVCRKITITAEG